MGKKYLMTEGLRRLLPSTIRDAAHERMLRDHFPFASWDSAPMSYGAESIAWLVSGANGTKLVCKVDRRPTQTKAVQELVEAHRELDELYGELVQPTSYLRIKQPYMGGKSVLARLQEFVDIRDDIFQLSSSELLEVNREDCHRFAIGLAEGIKDGQLPDCHGYKNTVVTQDYRIRMLDTTHMVTPNMPDWDRNHRLAAALIARTPVGVPSTV